MEPFFLSVEWTPILLLLIHLQQGTSSPELICPDVGYLGSPAHLTCIPPSNIPSHGYMSSQGEIAAICSVSNSSCTTLGNYMASTISQTHSSLTIPAVQQTHAGQWTCTIQPWSPLSCNFTVVKLPTCFTTSDADITTLDVGEELSLTVHIKGYYCSELVQLKISTGRTDHENPGETVTDITDKTVNIPIYKTNSNFEAELVFTCGGHSSTLPCHATSMRTPTITPSGDQSKVPPMQEDDRSACANVLWTGIGIGSGAAILMCGVCLGILIICRRSTSVLQASGVQRDITVQSEQGEGYLTPRLTRDNGSGIDEPHAEVVSGGDYHELEERRTEASDQYEPMRIYHEI
ncbi:uncharacterized protein [Haliotis cracherodii]|uniref:uncharacterized protein n=1 Tax=Haliotis cracherodii TaxID=6455 RepID=UPI0039E96252